MNYRFTWSFILLLIGCTQTPSIYLGKGTPSIERKINEIINESHLSTNLGIKAVSLRSGQILVDLNSNSQFNPASNNKIFTAIGALALLDTGYTFQTEIRHENDKLYLIGGGDPDLSLESLDSLARIVSNLPLSVKQLILDDTRHDSLTYGEGWMWDEGAWWYSAHISALSVNDNCVNFIIDPGILGKPAQVRTNPQSSYYSVQNKSITVNDTTGFKQLIIDRDWQNDTNHFTISGHIMDTTSTDTIFRNIEEPTRFVGHLFREMIAKKGIEIQTIRKGKTPASAQLITAHTSRTLPHTVKNLMVESDNLTAELLIKTIGFKSDGFQGNWKNGLIQIRTFLHDSVGMDTTTFSIKDGSGVSRYNYTSPDHFIQLLTWAYDHPKIRDQLLFTLPRGGLNGTLKDRGFPETVFAKTGSLSGVSNISGYIINDSDVIVFSILMNGFTGSAGPYRSLQDKIINKLSDA